MEYKRYIYLGKNIDLKEMSLTKGSVYFGEKIEKILKKYPLLGKILVKTDELTTFVENEVLFDKIVEDIKNQNEGGSN